MIWDAVSAGFKIGVTDFSRAWTLPTWFFGWSIRILANASVWIFLGSLLGSDEKTLFLLVGNATLAGPIAITWTIAAATWERMDGTYVLLMGAPTNIWGVMLGRTSVWLINGIATTVMAFSILGLLFDIYPPVDKLGWLIGCIVLTCVSVYGISLSIGIVATAFSRFRIILSNVLQVFFMTFCGVSVPVAFWPDTLRALVQLVPLVHGLDAIRAIYSSQQISVVVRHALLESLVAVSWVLISYLIYLAINKYGRHYGDVGSL